MKSKSIKLLTVLALSLPIAVISHSTVAQVASNWGMEFPTSQSGAAQDHFLEGVTYMHLHMFEDAEEHFQAAQVEAPDFAMAYWCEAPNHASTHYFCDLGNFQIIKRMSN